MIDPFLNIKNYLLTVIPLTDLVGDRIYPATTHLNLPAGYSPVGVGSAVAFNIRGGGTDYTSIILEPSVQFQSFAATEKFAYDIDRALHDALQDKKNKFFKVCRREVLGTLLYTPPPTLWPYVLSFFEFRISNVEV